MNKFIAWFKQTVLGISPKGVQKEQLPSAVSIPQLKRLVIGTARRGLRTVKLLNLIRTRNGKKQTLVQYTDGLSKAQVWKSARRFQTA